MMPQFTKILDRTVMSSDRDLSAETDYSDKVLLVLTVESTTDWLIIKCISNFALPNKRLPSQSRRW